MAFNTNWTGAATAGTIGSFKASKRLSGPYKEPLYCWHFAPDDGYTGRGERKKIVVGKRLTIKGNLQLCAHGYHGAEEPLDALRYAPGCLLCRVKLHGTVIRSADKAVASSRTALWMYDATNLLRKYAVTCVERAMTVMHRHGRLPDPRHSQWLDIVKAHMAGQASDDLLVTVARESFRVWSAGSNESIAGAVHRLAFYQDESAVDIVRKTVNSLGSSVYTGEGFMTLNRVLTDMIRLHMPADYQED